MDFEKAFEILNQRRQQPCDCKPPEDGEGDAAAEKKPTGALGSFSMKFVQPQKPTFPAGGNAALCAAHGAAGCADGRCVGMAGSPIPEECGPAGPTNQDVHKVLGFASRNAVEGAETEDAPPGDGDVVMSGIGEGMKGLSLAPGQERNMRNFTPDEARIDGAYRRVQEAEADRRERLLRDDDPETTMDSVDDEAVCDENGYPLESREQLNAAAAGSKAFEQLVSDSEDEDGERVRKPHVDIASQSEGADLDGIQSREIIRQLRIISNEAPDASGAGAEEPWNDGNLTYPRRVLKLQERRVAVQKAYDYVLKLLIERREIRTGYRPLVVKVTPAFQDVNEGLREICKALEEERKEKEEGNSQKEGSSEGKEGSSEAKSSGLSAPDLKELILSIEQILKLEEQKIQLVAACHMEQIRLYQSNITPEKKEFDERARRCQYQEVARVQKELQSHQQRIEDELTEIRYGY